jgi:hypothetical protein
MEDAPNITGVWEGESIWNAAINTADWEGGCLLVCSAV